jgi:hypothetical protein
MDVLSESYENILTRRANQRHYSIIALLVHGPAQQRALRRDCRQKPYRHFKLHWLARGE